MYLTLSGLCKRFGEKEVVKEAVEVAAKESEKRTVRGTFTTLIISSSDYV